MIRPDFREVTHPFHRFNESLCDNVAVIRRGSSDEVANGFEVSDRFRGPD
jgi:hypothetical protein